MTVRVSVTGASGFIGRHLVRRHLARGDHVKVLTRQPHIAKLLGPVDAVTCDLARPDPKVLAGFCEEADVLYHCAALLSDPAQMHQVNVLGTLRLLDSARGRCGRWVQLSSVGAYGPIREGVICENHPVAPQSEYEKTKAESDRLVEAAGVAGAIKYSILRPSNVFGPNMPNRSLRQLVSAIARGLFFFIGPPGASANYVHVGNVAEALIACGTKAAANGKVYNLSDFKTMEQFVGTIAEEVGRPVPRLRLPERLVKGVVGTLGWLPGFPLTESRVTALTSRVRYSSSLIEQELGYKHTVPMEDGLRQLVQAWRNEQ